MCSYNGEDFVCTQPRCAPDDEPDTTTPEDPTDADPAVEPDDTRPAQDDSHRPPTSDGDSVWTDLWGDCTVSAAGPNRGAAGWLLLGGLLLVVRLRRRRRPASTLLVASAALVAWGCSTSGSSAGRGNAGNGGSGGDTGTSGTGGTGTTGGSCEEITALSFQASSTRALFAITQPNRGESSNDFLAIEFFPKSGAGLSTGTFDLALEGDYDACKHCVRFDQDDKTTVKRVFFATSGTLELTATGVMPSASAGSLRDVKLVEVTVDTSTYKTTPVEGGKCYFLGSASWDTRLDETDPGGASGAGGGTTDAGVEQEAGSASQDNACSGLTDCQKCCADLHEAAAPALTTHALSCACDAGVCQAECATTVCAAVPSTADAECNDCLRFMFSGSNRCAEQVVLDCEQDPECAPLMACLTANDCAYLP